MQLISLTTKIATLLLGAAVGLAPQATAHEEPGSTEFSLLVPSNFMSGQISFVTLIGPESGKEILHTTWNLNFESPPGGTFGSDILMELQVDVDGVQKTWEITGADLGWAAKTGSFSGSLGSDELNGVLNFSPFGFTTPKLDMLSTTGGLTGKFSNSTIVLELAGDETCQVDLGFGGPGDLTAEMCGQALATGGLSTLAIDGAPASSTVFVLLGTNMAPTPFKGGTLVPVPFLLALPFNADAAGSVSVPVPGGSGPLTVFLQAVVADPGQPLGFAMSNALQLEFLP